MIFKKKGVALVTGGSGNLGKVISQNLSENYDVIITYNKTKLSKSFMKNLKGNNNMLYKCNLENEKEIRILIKKIKKKYKTLDLLINNASYTENLSENFILNPNKKIIKKILNTNFYSTYYITAETIKLMLKSKLLKKKNIIFILTNSIKTLNASNIIYTCAKSATETLMKYLAKKYGKKIRFNGISPGLIKTKQTSMRKKNILKISKITPLGRLANADDVINCINSILNNMTFLNGQNIYLDGGRTV